MRIEARTGENLSAQQQRLQEATRQVEAQFWHQLLRAMRRTVPAQNSSYTTQMYADLMDETLAQQLARTDQLGIARLLFEQLSPYLEDPSEGVRRERT